MRQERRKKGERGEREEKNEGGGGNNAKNKKNSFRARTVHRQDRGDRVVGQRGLGVGRLADRQLSRALVHDEPRPAGAELRRAGGRKLLGKVLHRAKVAVDGRGERGARAHLLGAHALPVERVVPDLRGVVERRGRLASRPRGLDDLLERLGLEVRPLDLAVEVGDVGAVVLAPVELHVVLGDLGLEGVLLKKKRLEAEEEVFCSSFFFSFAALLLSLSEKSREKSLKSV